MYILLCLGGKLVMSTSIIACLISVAVLLIINGVVVAYGYGKLSQKVEDTQRRLVRIERILNHGREG